jgi:hypothetical protein
VKTQAELNAALAVARPGDVIRLADRAYPAGLVVYGAQYAGMVQIVGSRSAVLGSLLVKDDSNVTVSGLTIEPPAGGPPALLTVKNSTGIVIDSVLVDGRDESIGATLDLQSTASNVTVQNSELTDCGSMGTCVLPGASGLLLQGNSFHDCLDCDFVRGLAYGAGVTISGNSFDRAVRGSCAGGPCNHNDHVQILGGGPWTIVGNRFGDRNAGAASVYVSTAANDHSYPVHDVLVDDNLLAGDAGLRGVWIGAGAGGGAGVPRNVQIVNNTILSGTDNGVFLPPGWLRQPAAARPLVANNVIAFGRATGCGGAAFSSNLVEQGATCPGSTDLTGAANLDASGRPTVESTRLVDAADPEYAPLLDYDGLPRVGLPDIGAFEWRGGPVDRTPPTVPQGLTVAGASTTTIDLGWQASSDQAGVADYLVGVGSSQVADVTGLSTRVGHLQCGTTYQLWVEAEDIAGNVSAPAPVQGSTLPC